MKVDKNKLKIEIKDMVDKVIEEFDRNNEISFFEIGIKHINGDLILSKYTTNKIRIK